MNRRITQEVCPFNNDRFVQITAERDYRPDWREADDRPEAPGDLPGTQSPREAVADEEPLVPEHAAWALERFRAP